MEAPAGARCFEGVRFALDLGPSMSLKEKTAFRELLEANGAIIDQVFTKNSDALVVTEERLRGPFQKVDKARKSFKPVVSTNYLVENAEMGRCVDAAVLALDGFLEPADAKAMFSEYVAKSDNKIVPSINEAVSLIQAVLAAPDQVPFALLLKLKRPIWMPHISALFARCVPDPRYVDSGSPDEDWRSKVLTSSSNNVIEQIRLEREKRNLALMVRRAEEKAEEERKHLEKRGVRRALEVMAREEESLFESQVEEQIDAIEEQRMASAFSYSRFDLSSRKLKKKKKVKKALDGTQLDHLYEGVSGDSSDSDSEDEKPKLTKANPFYNLTVAAKTKLLNPDESEESEEEAPKPRRRPRPQAEVRRKATISDEEGGGSESEGPDSDYSGNYSDDGYAGYSQRLRRRVTVVEPPKQNYLGDFESRIEKLLSATNEEFTAQLEESRAQREVQLKAEAEKMKLEALRSNQPVKPTASAKPPKPQSDAGLKVFIGGIKYDDITKASIAEKWTADKVKQVKEARIKEIKRLCGTFGSIKTWEEKWDEGFAFVTFEAKESADQMQRTLSQFDHRKGLCKQIRTRILAEKGEKLAVPSHSFYVRWPKFYQRIVENNKKKRAEEKANEKEEKEKAKALIPTIEGSEPQAWS